ncbi:hypothetical protein [Burkholderia sp. S171]|uniref:hypothetical protein n=1 Tax=Burkholderia sp. S171 TaxID=1641860 RepID=UPI00131B8C3A|nr:hypothetical protein [Burkholderia sp. S171]
MNRIQFLAQPQVAAFIKWLCDTLPELPVSLRIERSRFNSKEIDIVASGLEDVLRQYSWNASWQDVRTGERVASSDWVSTRKALVRLSEWLRESVVRGDDSGARSAAIEVLRWGGVRGAIAFIERLARENALCGYLQRLGPLFALDGNQDISALDATIVQRFDAGLTKVHALFDKTGSPIYDSRVGAAFAMLYEMFRSDVKHPDGRPFSPLGFPSGSARGQQIRDPGEFGMASAPQFYTNRVTRDEWARWQLRTGWIIREVLANTSLFASEASGHGESGLAARAHAFEASMFMIGYDLRCLNADADQPIEAVRSSRKATGRSRTGNWVPTSHPFGRVMQIYRTYREANPRDNELFGLEQWVSNFPIGTAEWAFSTSFKNYIYPLQDREFSLLDKSLDDVRVITDGGREGLYRANDGATEFLPGDEREQVCLVCAGLTGYVYGVDGNRDARVRQLVNAEFAGNEGGAEVLMYVGRGVGQHFGLLDTDFQSTALFHRFFGEGFSDFRGRLSLGPGTERRR